MWFLNFKGNVYMNWKENYNKLNILCEDHGRINLSKFERYKKKVDIYIYPHKHCKNCGEMIHEGITYCSDCYMKLQEKKKWFKWKRKKKTEEPR